MRLEIRARDLPGRRFGTEQGSDVIRGNVSVGIQVRREPEQVVAADVEQVTFTADVMVIPLEHGNDFRGPAVQGRRGERFVYLTWGDVDAAGSFTMFRRAKLMLDTIAPTVISTANQPDAVLVADLGLTDGRGGPLCARVVPPTVDWRAERVEPRRT